jgi:hypothetical protein
MVGLDDVVDVRHLTRNEAGWVAIVSVPRDGSGSTGARDEIRYSDDGKHWHPVPGVQLGDNASVIAIVPNYPRFVLVTNEPVDNAETRITAWTSEDRLHWEAHHVATLAGEATGLTGPEPWFPTETGPFALVGSETVDGATHPRAWTSPDGTAWSVAAIASEAGTTPSGVRAAAVGPMGLIDSPGPMLRNNFAVAGHGGGAWTSTDTTSWTPVPFVPPDAAVEPTAVAVLVGVVVVAGSSPDGPIMWVHEVFPSRYPGS